MDSMLILVTVIALALAIVMTGLVVKLLADERRRSAARVAMLSSMAADATPSARPAVSDDFELRHLSPSVASGELFAAPVERSAWPRRLGAVAGIALFIFAIGVAARTARSLGAPSSSPEAATGNASPQGSTSLLDLLSLRHEQESDVLTITGLVQNPREGAPLANIVATALLFGADGTFLASGRAPLDFTVLRPGAETGFVISVPVRVPVARYRVGFRGEDGRIIGHVDRRSTGTIARGPS